MCTEALFIRQQNLKQPGYPSTGKAKQIAAYSYFRILSNKWEPITDIHNNTDESQHG